jgi:glycosyltransferase involved in cell wall biosynthesis
MSASDRKLRVLHIHHALYVNYLLVRGLRQLGHKAANVYFNFTPGTGSADLTWGCDYNLSSSLGALPRQITFLFYAIANYDIFHFWGSPFLIPAFFQTFSKHLPLDLRLLHWFGKKIIFQSDGCMVMVRPSVWKTQIDPEICYVCQTTQGDTYGYCSNDYTIRLNSAMERYADLKIGMGLGYDFEATAIMAFVPVDVELWNPHLVIPSEYIFPRKNPDSVLIYHGVGLQGVPQRGNIKGTLWIKETVAQLQAEGYNVELMYVEAIPNRIVRYYQAQADIVVDQLLVGGGGQMSRECLALGKPVLTRVHPEQIEAYKKAAAPFDPPPYIPTDRITLKANLIRLLENPVLRREIGEKSAEFARNVLTPAACAQKYLDFYQALYK